MAALHGGFEIAQAAPEVPQFAQNRRPGFVEFGFDLLGLLSDLKATNRCATAPVRIATNPTSHEPHDDGEDLGERGLPTGDLIRLLSRPRDRGRALLTAKCQSGA